MASPDLPAFSPPFPPQNETERAALLEWIRTVPLIYGVWKDFKGFYKQAEAGDDREIQAEFIARLDREPVVLEADPSLQLWGDIGSPLSIALRDRYAFVITGQYWGNDQKLHVFDITDPFRPQRLASLAVSNGTTVTCLGDILIVAPHAYYGSQGQFLVIDVGNPAAPRQITTFTVADAASIVAGGNRVYLMAQARGNQDITVAIWDLTQPAQPRRAGQLKIENLTALATLGDDYIYALAGNTGFSWTGLPRTGGLRVFDVSNPAQPQQAGSLDLKDATTLVVDGHHAYVGTGSYGSRNAGLQVVDIADPQRPRKVGSLSGDAVQALTVSQGYAYLQTSDGLRIVDVSNPAKPRAVTSLSASTNYYSSRLSIQGDFLYISSGYGGMEMINVADPAKPFRVGATTSVATIGYMKRRARRFLRRRSQEDADAFVELAYEVLNRSRAKKNALALNHQWVTADLLFGGGDRYEQKRHGRGGYALKNPRLSLKRREERAPQAWNARPDLARQLWENEKLPWQIHEAALKMLRAMGEDVPALNNRRVARFLESDSPLLMRLAAQRVLEQMQAGREVRPEIVARTFFLSSGSRRSAIRARLPGYATTAEWSRKFASTLFEIVKGGIDQGQMSRRQAGAMEFLVDEFSGEVPSQSLMPVLVQLLSSAQEKLVQFALQALRQVPLDETVSVLQTLRYVPEERRERALAALLESVRGRGFDLEVSFSLVQHPSADMREMGWRVLAASATEPAVLRGLWEGLFASPGENPHLQTAMTFPEALSLLDRAAFAPEELAAKLREKPFLVRMLSPEVFTRVATIIPPAVALQLVAEATDELWNAVRSSYVSTLRGEKLVPFWQAVWAELSRQPEGRVYERVVNDAEVAATFRGIEAMSFDGFLRTEDPQFGPLLHSWLEAHQHEVEKGGSILLTTATHALVPVREWGLARVREVGMEMPFALRLLEAELPSSVSLGREYFENDESDQSLEYSLVLCDSPVPSVRAYGREFVEKREDVLPRKLLLRRLFENPNPDIQSFVAARLLEDDEAPTTTVEFDEGVLRARNQARHAKELVKQRLDRPKTNKIAENVASPVDVTTLLELARSRTPRDAEWALAQLAKLALEGQEIEGLDVSGVAGV